MKARGDASYRESGYHQGQQSDLFDRHRSKQNVDFQFTDKDSVAGRHFYYVRLQQDDGMLAWSSPFFINYQ